MVEIIRKVGNGYIYFCPGCKELHYVDETFVFYGTLEVPSFKHCLVLTKEPIPEDTQTNGSGHKIVHNSLVECQSSIHGGVLFFHRGKHDLNGYYEMVPVDSKPDIIPNCLGRSATDLLPDIRQRYYDSLTSLYRKNS